MSDPSVDPIARNIAIMTTIFTGLMVSEYMWSLSDETRLVWPRFWKTIEAKNFVVIRYAGLTGQIFNIWFAFRMASGVPNSPSACIAWCLYQTVTTQCLLFSVQLLLMRRVYKMFNKSKSIFALSVIFSGTQLAAMAASARLFITGTGYSPTCVIISSHHSRNFVGVSIIVTFMFILVTMLWRFFGTTSSGSEALRAWLRLAVRDGSCTIFAIMVIIIFMFLCNMRVIDTKMSGNIIFYVLILCLWFAAGRIVLHQEKLRKIQESQMGDVNDPSRWTQSIEVDLDDIAIASFDDPDACPPSPSSLEVESTEVSTPLDFMSDAGTRDIADEHLYEWEEDNVPLTSCAPTFVLIERRIGGEGSGSTE
ncbi:hypothetical protein DFJ58DRAFT_800229 [Suillus subalutaceus]|uniref:uncharacterized protein n=1 Tax=Suillus subalutaceus TaxID=48586 RepID=UPI001B87E8C7|nr:uncharacterized protein DFJ58DRAFT_800229 [Suillus subalutaceus]KAG1845903.1 hypothetical protein DFJ58DRAFT_800229 [Suillus subalutaceus]